MSNKENKPNIIYIMADDLGYFDLGCYGQEKIKTPNIDQLAEDGMRFTQCYAGSTVCAPSRSVLMTGQHTGHTRIRDNFAKVGGVKVMDNRGLQRRPCLKKEDTTVAELLKDAGYKTGITGKWGLAEPNTSGVPNKKGFDRWFGYLNQRRAHTYYPPYLWQNEEKVILEKNKYNQRGTYSHNLFTQYALDFIKDNRKEPFFLYLPYTIPHGSWEIPDDSPYSNKSWSQKARNFAAMVTLLDKDVGRIMDLLKKLGLYEDTVIFFCSDNGGGSRFQDIFNSNGPFRGYKGDLYEGGLRIPMIVSWPGEIPAGEVNDETWYFADFLPTAADIAGIDIPDDVDGVSILPTLLEKNQNLKDRYLYWEHFSNFKQAVRKGKWKAVRFGLEEPLELYNLAKDIGEENNVSDEHPEIVKEIEQYLEGARTKSETFPVEL